MSAPDHRRELADQLGAWLKAHEGHVEYSNGEVGARYVDPVHVLDVYDWVRARLRTWPPLDAAAARAALGPRPSGPPDAVIEDGRAGFKRLYDWCDGAAAIADFVREAYADAPADAPESQAATAEAASPAQPSPNQVGGRAVNPMSDDQFDPADLHEQCLAAEAAAAEAGEADRRYWQGEGRRNAVRRALRCLQDQTNPEALREALADPQAARAFLTAWAALVLDFAGALAAFPAVARHLEGLALESEADQYARDILRAAFRQEEGRVRELLLAAWGTRPLILGVNDALRDRIPDALLSPVPPVRIDAAAGGPRPLPAQPASAPVRHHGGRSYSLAGETPVALSAEQDNALKAFLDRGEALTTRQLEERGVSNVAKVMKKLRQRFGEAVRLPARKGDGYYIHVRTLK
jgi:hypothetical protein